jgi:aarF domain-containing kinase
MVYGRQGEFDAERLIDLLEALEKFKAIRDDGDGTAYKVDGVRGNKVVGSAGDFRGSQVVDTSDRDTDVGDGRFRVTTATPRASSASRPQSSIGGLSNIGGSNFQRQSEEDKETLRESLRFFFSPEGEPFRDFMLEEIVTVVDASSREAVNELVRNLGLSNFPLPSLFKALNPELNDTDKRMVQQIGKLIQFLFGDFDSALGDGARNGGGMAAARARALLPVVREYRSELSYFGRLLVARLTEKNLQRSLNWASNRLTPEPMR